VNPGSLLHHPRLVTLLPEPEVDRLRRLTPADLWQLEDKRDVDLDAVYGKGTVELSAALRALVLIKWRLGGDAFGVRRLDGAEALTNVPLFGKDLGVFDADRPVRPERAVERFGDYAAILERLTVVEVTGRPDFEALVDVVGDLLAK
jgi:HprK-related kinase B